MLGNLVSLGILNGYRQVRRVHMIHQVLGGSKEPEAMIDVKRDFCDFVSLLKCTEKLKFSQRPVAYQRPMIDSKGIHECVRKQREMYPALTPSSKRDLIFFYHLFD